MMRRLLALLLTLCMATSEALRFGAGRSVRLRLQPFVRASCRLPSVIVTDNKSSRLCLSSRPSGDSSNNSSNNDDNTTNNGAKTYSDSVIATPTLADASKPQGYASSDLDALGEGKQLRALAYIGLALVPCLFLVPFFLARDFVPPVEPEAMIP